MVDYKLDGKKISAGSIKKRLAARKKQTANAKYRKDKDKWDGSVTGDLVAAMDESKPISSQTFHGGFPSFTKKKLNNMDHSDA